MCYLLSKLIENESLKVLFFFDDLQPDGALTRAVELAKENGLPSSQLQGAVFYRQKLSGAREQAFDMRVGIAFGVKIIAVARNTAFQKRRDVALDIGIVAFLHRDSGGRVRRVNQAQAALHAALRHRFFDARRDVHQFALFRC
jgi:hypothetical protein